MMCRTYFVEIRTENTIPYLCVDSCPVGTYLPGINSTECVPCHEHCNDEEGCAGPLPYLDRNNGCIECSLVQLTQSGAQVKMSLYILRS